MRQQFHRLKLECDLLESELDEMTSAQINTRIQQIRAQLPPWWFRLFIMPCVSSYSQEMDARLDKLAKRVELVKENRL